MGSDGELCRRAMEEMDEEQQSNQIIFHCSSIGENVNEKEKEKENEKGQSQSEAGKGK